MALRIIREITLDEQEASDAFQTALQQQQRLSRNLKALREAMLTAKHVIPDLDETLKALQLDASGLDDFFSNCLDPRFYAGSPNPNSTSAARKVFDVSELVEAVLEHLDVADLLRVQQVDRSMRDLVNSSTKIQRQMLLKVDNEGAFRVSHALPAGNCIHADGLATATDDHYIQQVSLIMKPMPCVGTRIRNMYICQPSITFMTYKHVCKCSRDQSQHFLKNVAGIKWGDVLDATVETSAQHKLCPFAYPHSLDDNGEVVSLLPFSGAVSLRCGDPLLQAQHEGDENRREVHFARMKAYTAAKRNGWFQFVFVLYGAILTPELASNNGLPIPTLAQWEAAIASA